MNKCKLRFKNVRRAQLNGYSLTPTDHIILVKSDPLTHVEFQFSSRHNRKSFSATMAGDDNGCRFKDIGYSNPCEWTTITLYMSDAQEDRAWARANEIDGKSYDLIGLASFGTDWSLVKPDPDKYWCSEACAELIKAAYGYLAWVPSHFHPVGLFFEMYHRMRMSDAE